MSTFGPYPPFRLISNYSGAAKRIVPMPCVRLFALISVFSFASPMALLKLVSFFNTLFSALKFIARPKSPIQVS